MMEIYQGIDIVNIPRFIRSCERNENFIEEIFTTREKAYCLKRRLPHLHLAGRFGAKEAALKALGMGMWGTGIDQALREIEILTGKRGKPVVSFSGWVEKISIKKKISSMTVSISHSSDYAVATVTLLGEKIPPRQSSNS